MPNEWAKNSEKQARAQIQGFLEEDEPLVGWCFGATAPAEWMGFLPGFSTYYKMNTRGWAMVLTPERVLRLRNRGVLKWDLDFEDEYDLADLKAVSFADGWWVDQTTFRLQGETLVLKDVGKEEATAFIKAWKKVKKGGGLAENKGEEEEDAAEEAEVRRPRRTTGKVAKTAKAAGRKRRRA